jgi:hypothetical protein
MGNPDRVSIKLSPKLLGLFKDEQYRIRKLTGKEPTYLQLAEQAWEAYERRRDDSGPDIPQEPYDTKSNGTKVLLREKIHENVKPSVGNKRLFPSSDRTSLLQEIEQSGNVPVIEAITHNLEQFARLVRLDRGATGEPSRRDSLLSDAEFEREDRETEKEDRDINAELDAVKKDADEDNRVARRRKPRASRGGAGR